MRTSSLQPWGFVYVEAMILINLLPPELRQGTGFHPLFRDRRKVATGGGVLFVALTLIFYLQYQLSLKTVKELEGRWHSFQKDIQRVTEFEGTMERGARGEKRFLDQYVTSALPVTTILSAVSEFLPDSIWLVELKVSRQAKENTFLLKGFSLPFGHRSSIQDIEKYLRDIKEKFPPKTELILTTSRQTRENRELTLFTAIFKWS